MRPVFRFQGRDIRVDAPQHLNLHDPAVDIEDNDDDDVDNSDDDVDSDDNVVNEVVEDDGNNDDDNANEVDSDDDVDGKKIKEVDALFDKKNQLSCFIIRNRSYTCLSYHKNIKISKLEKLFQ